MIRRSSITPPVVVVISALLILTGCSSKDGDKGSAGRASEATRIVRQYLRGLQSGDLGAAMGVRCKSARVGRSQQSLFRDQAARLFADRGEIHVENVRLLPAGEGPVPIGNLHAEYHFAYRLTSSGSRSTADLTGVIVKEGGKSRWCGYSTASAGRFHEDLPATLGDLGSTTNSLSDLMPLAPEATYQQATDGEQPTGSEEVARWSRTWRVGDYGGARVDAIKYRTSEAADAAAVKRVAAYASDAVSEIEVGVPSAIGVRFLGFAWLWVQPPDQGPYVDTVTMRFGDTVVYSTVSNLPSGSDSDAVIALAHDIAARAQGR